MPMKVTTGDLVSLTNGCIAFTKAMRSVDSAQARADTTTDAIIKVAMVLGSLKSWDAVIEDLSKSARSGTAKHRKAIGFEQELREDKGGNKYKFTFPNKYLAVVFSTIRQTLKRGLPVADKSGAVLTFNQLKINKAKDIEKSAKGATGRTKDKRDLISLQKEQRARAKNLTDTEFHNFVNRLRIEVGKMPTSKAA